MSKPVKKMMIEEYRERLGEHDALVVSIRGMDAFQTNTVRNDLRKKSIRMTMVRNDLFRTAFAESGLKALDPVMNGQNTVVYGAESVVEVAREIVELLKAFPDIELKGAVLDGELFEGTDGVERLSKFPTREEAIGQAVGLILGPGRKLVAQVQGPGRNVAGLVKAIETKLEAGETIAAVS
ncbi:MAG: 50S ribosomal protein L10 [Planctomycetota bacterium]